MQAAIRVDGHTDHRLGHLTTFKIEYIFLMRHSQHKRTLHAPHALADTTPLPISEGDDRTFRPRFHSFLRVPLGNELLRIGPEARIPMNCPGDKAQ